MTETSKEEVLIEADGVWKKYGSLQVLKGLNLQVKRGETLVILGRSGVGKSVLLRQILGIEVPEKGLIKIGGKPLCAMNKSERHQTVKLMGMLFQGAALFDSLTVGENIAFYLREHELKMAESEIQDKVADALKMVGLSGIESKMPSELSGGMRKRAALARLIVYRPHIILYDEPTTGLDPVTSMQINELINRTQQELQATSIVVTHDIRSAMEVGDRLAFHDDGQIAQIASKEDFLKIEDPRLKAFFANAILTPEILKNSSKRN